MSKRFLYAMLITLLVSGLALAQYGKISGRVIDKQSKEPLIGANVVIIGTTQGAATDIEGRYVILNVAPGTYDVKVTYVGYQDVTIKNIRVIAGLTEEVNFEAASSAVEVQGVEIIAERPLIEKSATNAIRVMKSEDLTKLPVRGATAYVNLQPGVVLQNDRVHIRGGRSDEVGFNVEGATTSNILSRDGGSLVATVPEALEEISVQAGGYTAEFGGANSGLVSQSLRTGKEQYHASFQVETDNLSGFNFEHTPGDKFFGGYSYGYSNYAATVSGPIVSNKIRFFAAGENSFIRDFTPIFFTGLPERWSDGALIDTTKVYDDGTRGGNKSEYQILRLASGNLSGRMRNRYSLNTTVLFDFQPVSVKLGGLFSWQRTRTDNDDPIGNMFDHDRLPQTDISSALVNAKVNYYLSTNTFLEANINYLDRRAKAYDPNFEDDLLSYGDSIQAALRGWQYPRYAGQPQQYDFYGFPFNRPGTALTGFGKSQSGYIGGSASITSQVNKHEIKAGISGEFWTSRNYGIGGLTSLLDFMRLRADSSRDVDALTRLIRQQSTPNIYGYDMFGRSIDGGDDGPKKPKFFSVYVQDKVEFQDLIINAGLRYDHIDLDAFAFADPLHPYRDDFNVTLPPVFHVKSSTGGDSVVQNLKKVDPFDYLSPRLGFSFPVTDRTVFHLQYGKFVQSPALDVAYRGLPAATQQIQGGFYFRDPISYGLEPTRTTSYEIGFTQQFSDFAAFDITGFYKDIKGQVQYDVITTTRGFDPSSYPIYSNGDFATTKGLELRVTLRRVNRVQAVVNYTLSDARGTNSFPSSAGAGLNVTGTKPTTVTPLLFDQTHRGSINIDFRFAKNDGGPILERLGANFLFTFNSGHRYTKAAITGLGQQDASTGGLLNDQDSRQRQPVEPINSSTTPWIFNLDLRIDKTVSIAGYDFNIYTYVQNLLNTKNVTNVYYGTGNAFDDGFLSNAANQGIINNLGSRFEDLYRVVNLEDRRHNFLLNGFDLFGTPRQVRLGIRMDI